MTDYVSVFLLRWIDRQCKYVCAYLCVSVCTAVCSHMYAFTHVFIIDVFTFCCEAFKGALLGIFLPFYTQKMYSIICRSTKLLKEKERNQNSWRALFPRVATFSAVSSEPGLRRLPGRVPVIVHCTFDGTSRVSYLIRDKAIETNWFLSAPDSLCSYIQNSLSLLGFVLALCCHPDSQSLRAP